MYTILIYELSETTSFRNDTQIPAQKLCQNVGGIRWRQKPQAPTPQAPVRNRQTRKVANAKVRIG